MSDVSARFEAKIKSRQATAVVVGLGYVGIPHMLAAARAGFRTTGYDHSADRVAALVAGRPVLNESIAKSVTEQMASGQVAITTDASCLQTADIAVICVPTPLTPQRTPDLSYIARATETVARTLHAGQLVVLESTSYPGTTSEIVRPILEQSGLRSGKDFFLAYSPEREDPGNTSYALGQIPKVVAGDGPDALRLATAYYSSFVADVVTVTSMETAEAVKITENVFRAVNIALVNELKLIYTPMGIDIWEVIDAAKTKPFGYMPFYPGPGLGGHCIPIDPFYLSWKAREFGLSAHFIELAGNINTIMPRYVLDQLVEALDRSSGRGLNGTRILIIGAAYKPGVADIRESPALALMTALSARGAYVSYHDPLVPAVALHEAPDRPSHFDSVLLTADYVREQHAIVIITDHDQIDYILLRDNASLIVDTRNAMARRGLRGDNVVKA